MSLHESLRTLAKRFREGHARWPSIRHILLEAADQTGRQNLDSAAKFLHSAVHQWNNNSSVNRSLYFGFSKYEHILNWDPCIANVRGIPNEAEAFLYFDGSCEIALKLLSDLGGGTIRLITEWSSVLS